MVEARLNQFNDGMNRACQSALDQLNQEIERNALLAEKDRALAEAATERDARDIIEKAKAEARMMRESAAQESKRILEQAELTANGIK
jgi:F0F1-type ATP synthase membrane subunit b/b'